MARVTKLTKEGYRQTLASRPARSDAFQGKQMEDRVVSRGCDDGRVAVAVRGRGCRGESMLKPSGFQASEAASESSTPSPPFPVYPRTFSRQTHHTICRRGGQALRATLFRVDTSNAAHAQTRLVAARHPVDRVLGERPTKGELYDIYTCSQPQSLSRRRLLMVPVGAECGIARPPTVRRSHPAMYLKRCVWTWCCF